MHNNQSVISTSSVTRIGMVAKFIKAVNDRKDEGDFDKLSHRDTLVVELVEATVDI